MPQLLVSVRDCREARVVLAVGGVDLLDVKEPRRGALGRPSAATVRGILAEVAGRTPISVAAGELVDAVSENDIDDGATFAACCAQADYVKFGLAGAGSLDDWPARWNAALAGIRSGATQRPPQAVAVVYADWQTARAPCPEAVLDAGATFKCRAALLDTLEKRRGSLTEQWTDEQIAAFVRGAHDRGMWAVIGGSLTVESIPSVIRLGADIVAVRGAACRARREGTIDPDRVARLAATVRMCANAIC